ncbi:hypothetical protein CCR75_002607 [Bremia lactucae]|uniref:5'-nucleotidase n=1 Tax=Bremia lactucae TaxID=4779 RepID=A0A976ILE1_BRELC|nr:hypothetical protein CCR75_002607 [Bremia lactucae]
MPVWQNLAVALSVFFDYSAHARSLTATFDLLSYNDVYELQQDTVEGLKLGGPSRVVPIANAMRRANPNSLVLLAGDTISPSLWSARFNGQQMIKAHNAIGLDFASLGNHEFDYGLDNFLNVSRTSNFTWLNANCYEHETQQLLRGTVPNAIKNFHDSIHGNISIGLFGIMYNLNDSSTGLCWKDPIEAAKEQVAILQAQNVDFIIALSHQSLTDDNRLSKEVVGIDLIVGGHDHASMLQTSYGTPYLKSDSNFHSIWTSHVNYYAADDSHDRKALMTHHAIPILENLPTDKALDAVIATYAALVNELEKQIISSLCEDLDLSQNVVRVQDSKIGHLFADASREFYGNGSVDIAVMNGGGIRGDKIVPAGDLSLGEVLSWSPFGNILLTIETNGASLKLFLEHEMGGNCGDRVILQNGFYIHPSGFQYTFKCMQVGVGVVSSLLWLNHPIHSGEIQDTDEFLMALSQFLYTSRLVGIDGIQANVKINEAEAGRVDTAIETYVSKQSNGILCPSDNSRSFVTF